MEKAKGREPSGGPPCVKRAAGARRAEDAAGAKPRMVMRSRHGPSIGSGSTIVEHVAACCTSTSGSGPPHPGNLECSYRPSSRVLEGGGLAGLDRHADFALVARRERQQPVRHLRQSCTAVLELPLPEHVPGGVKHARLMFLRPPVDTRKPCQLQVEPPVCRVERARPDACRSLYWRSTAQTPHGASIGGWSPGHVSSSGARDTGDWMVAPGGLLRLREIIPRSHPERYRGLVATREALPVAWHAPTDSPRGSGRAGQGGGEVRRYRGSRVMPAEGRDLRWKRWRKGAGSRERPNGLSPRR